MKKAPSRFTIHKRKSTHRVWYHLGNMAVTRCGVTVEVSRCRIPKHGDDPCKRCAKGEP